jgi:hypothetical protein
MGVNVVKGAKNCVTTPEIVIYIFEQIGNVSIIFLHVQSNCDNLVFLSNFFFFNQMYPIPSQN